MYDLLCQLSGVAHPGILPDLLNLWNKHYKHELFCVREQRALGCRRVSSKEKSRYPGRISGNDRPGGAVTQQRWHALNVGERLWFRFARITGREILGPEWDGLTLLGKGSSLLQLFTSAEVRDRFHTAFCERKTMESVTFPNLNKLHEIVKDRKAWRAAVHWVKKS